MQNVVLAGWLAAVASPLFLIAGIVTLIVHVVFALAVYSDATDRDANRRGLVLVGPGMWAVTTLLTGLLGAVAYWLVHSSALATEPLARVLSGAAASRAAGAADAGTGGTPT